MAHIVRLRRDRFQEQASALGHASQSAQARAMGVHVSIHNRVISGVTKEMSGAYVVGLLLFLGPDCVRDALRDLFEIEIDEREAVAS